VLPDQVKQEIQWPLEDVELHLVAGGGDAHVNPIN
jgi:hypothetical protein